MTVQSEIDSIGYSGPAAGPFPIPFRFLADGDIRITKRPADGSGEVTLVLTTDYSLIGARQQSGGSASLVVPLVTGDRIVIDRGNMQRTQLIDYQANDPFPEEAAEDGLDRLTMLIQQGERDGSDRSLRLGVTDIDGSGAYQGKGNRISNISEAATSTDVPTLGQVTGLIGPGASTFLQAGANAVIRTHQDKERDIVSLLDFSDAVSQTGQLNNVVANGKEFTIPSGDYIVTGFSNNLGIPHTGDGRILKSITGGLQQLNTRVDRDQHVTGREYLFHWTETLRTTRTAKAVCSGDSTTEGGGLAPAYLFHQYIMHGGYNAGFKVEAINAGHSSMDTSDWVDTYLAGDLAQNPDLYVVRWGINDPFNGRTLEQFVESLRDGLAQCRAAKTVAQMSILLCVPNTTGDTPNGRDEKWYELMRLAIHQAGRDFQCCVVDLYAMFKDPRNGAGLWLDNPFFDGRGIHPTPSFAIQIGSAVNDVLYPQNLLPKLIESTLFTTDVGALPSTYPLGTSIYNSPSPGTWPIQNAVITTHRSADGNLIQFCMSTNSADFGSAAANGGLNLGQIAVRSGAINAAGTINGWHKWVTEPSVSLSGLLVNGWVDFNTDCTPRAMKSNNVVTLTGMIKNGTITDGTTLFTLPVGYRPRQNPEFALAQCGTTAAVVPCSIRILSSGVVALMDGGVAGFLSLTGISFEAGN